MPTSTHDTYHGRRNRGGRGAIAPPPQLTLSQAGEADYAHHIITPPPHCTEIDFALSFGAVIVKMIDLSKTDSRDFFGIILDQKNSQKLHFLPKTC